MLTAPKILLVHPRYLDERIQSEDAGVMPIGLFYMGALLIEKGYKTALLNLAASKRWCSIRPEFRSG